MYWNNDPSGRWLGPEKLGYTDLDSQCTCVFLDNGARMNTVMLAYIRTHHLDMGPITELQSVIRGIPIHRVGGACMVPWATWYCESR